MLKKHMAACLVVTAFAAAPAFAQTSPGPSAPTDRPLATGSGSTASGSPAMQPGASGSSSMGSSVVNQSGAMQGQFLTQMQSGQMRASKLIGTRVVSANNESIGDINDVVMDRNGQVMAIVVGVGGFLGIGEKDVAVPFNALEFATSQQASATANNNVSSTGSTVTSSSSSANEPERVVLRMTKAELQAAPAFKAPSDDSAHRSTPGAGGGTSTAPKQ